MNLVDVSAGLVPMDKPGRAQDIRERARQLGDPSVRQLHKLGGGDESTISKILNGDPDVVLKVRDASFLQLERTLDEMSQSFGPGVVIKPTVSEPKRLDTARTPDVVIVCFEGVYGIEKITIESPPDAPPETLREAIESVERLVQRARDREQNVKE